MPDKCCIVGCESNYSGGSKKSVFYFPKDDDLKRKWVPFVNRKDWIPTKHSVICVDHFEEKYVARHTKKTLLKWNLSPTPSIYPLSISLTASSSILPTISSTRKPPRKRASPTQNELDDFKKEELIHSINDLTENHCPDGFIFNKQCDDTVVVYFRMAFQNGVMKIHESISISSELKVTLSYDGMPIPLPEWLRTAKNCKISRVSQLLKLPSYIQSRVEELPPNEILNEIRSLNFLKPQGRPPFSSKVLRYSLLLRYSSRQAYSLLLQEFPLPSFSLLEKLSRGSLDALKVAKTFLDIGKISKDCISK